MPNFLAFVFVFPFRASPLCRNLDAKSVPEVLVKLQVSTLQYIGPPSHWTC